MGFTRWVLEICGAEEQARARRVQWHVRPRSWCPGSLPDLEHGIDLDGDVVVKGWNGNGCAGVSTGLAEECDEKIGRAVDDKRLLREVRGGVDVATDPYAPDDTVEITDESAADVREEIERTETSGLLALLDRDVAPELSDDSGSAITKWELAAEVEKGANPNMRHVVGAGDGGRGESESEGAKPRFDLVCHARML